MNVIFLITQDYYLFQGVKGYFPETIQLNAVDRRSFNQSNEECIVLIDSRLPLVCWQNIIASADNAGSQVRCVVLDMRSSEADALGLRWSLDMSLPHTDVKAIVALLQKIEFAPDAKTWLHEMRLSPDEYLMMRQLRSGLSMEEIAVKSGISVKSLYRKRNHLHERLGLANFNEACLLIFRGGLLDSP